MCYTIEIVNLNKFQSTHPRGVRHLAKALSGDDPMFQSTHPRGVRRSCVIRHPLTLEFQSTHPRGVRPMWRLRTSAKK